MNSVIIYKLYAKCHLFVITYIKIEKTTWSYTWTALHEYMKSSYVNCILWHLIFKTNLCVTGVAPVYENEKENKIN